MRKLKSAATTLMVMTGISLGIMGATAIPLVTSGGPLRSPQVFHCC
jgi:hypothetical protein